MKIIYFPFDNVEIIFIFIFFYIFCSFFGALLKVHFRNFQIKFKLKIVFIFIFIFFFHALFDFYGFFIAELEFDEEVLYMMYEIFASANQWIFDWLIFLIDYNIYYKDEWFFNFAGAFLVFSLVYNFAFDHDEDELTENTFSRQF